MPKVKPETLALRREEILRAAENCFARQGFHQTTIQDVIKESDLSAGCIYGHFASKEELIQAISESRHRRDSALLAAKGEATDPLTSLRAIARVFLGDLQKEAGLQARRVGLQLWAEALRDDVIREQVASGIRQPIALIADMLRRGQKSGVIDRAVLPRGAARAMVAMFQGVVLQRLWGETISTAEAMQVFETFLTGLAAKH
jgi:AcrR family transcriptional regulator